MPAGGSYGNKSVGEGTANTLKRQAASRVSYVNTKLRPRSKEGNGHLGTVKSLPKP